MEVQGITVKKIIDPVLIGMHNGNLVHLCYGPYGYYIKHNTKNYSLPKWADPDELDLYQAVKIIDYKMKNTPKYDTKKESIFLKEDKINTFQNYKHSPFVDSD